MWWAIISEELNTFWTMLEGTVLMRPSFQYLSSLNTDRYRIKNRTRSTDTILLNSINFHWFTLDTDIQFYLEQLLQQKEEWYDILIQAPHSLWLFSFVFYFYYLKDNFQCFMFHCRTKTKFNRKIFSPLWFFSLLMAFSSYNKI